MQLVSSRIWTRVAESNSYDDNHYTTGTSFWLVFIPFFTIQYSIVFMYFMIVMSYFLLFWEFFITAFANGFYWSLSASKFSQVFRTLLSILTDLDNAVVWIIFTCPLVSMSFSPFTKILEIFQVHQIQLVSLSPSCSIVFICVCFI